MLSWFVIIPIIIAILLYIIPFKKAGKVLAIAAQLVFTCFTFYLFFECKEGSVITRVGNYRGVLGITLKADTLSSVFVMLTSLIFLIAALYNFNEKFSKLFGFLLFIWEGLLIGVFLSCDLFNIFVLMEVVTVVVSILIMFNRDNRSMYDGMVYLMVNTVAIQFYLFGVGYIYKLTGVLDMDSAAKAFSSLDKSEVILPVALIMTTISLKCALVPLFSWLPRAHGTPGAPPVVSAILSGLHVKTGVYLFIRFQSVFMEAAVPNFFLVAGILTGIAGFILAISQSDIKLILAYHTISQIGMIMIGLNTQDLYSYTGSTYHIINHAFFKSALFLSAGIIVKIYGTRDIYKIHGVLRQLPLVGAATIMATLGITGAPFFNGSVSKYFIMSSANWMVNGAVIFINLGTIISFIKYSSILFGSCTPEHIQKIDGYQQAAVLILGIFCLTGGIFGEQFIEFLFNISVNVEATGYFQKVSFFALSVIAGYLIYRYYIKKSKLFNHHIREVKLGFRGICVSIGIFFALIIIFLKLEPFPKLF